jgi:hypothetical protein
MAVTDITRTSASPFIPAIWANTALEILRNRVVLAKLVTRDSDIAAFQVGDTLNIPYPGTFVANDKAANTNVSMQVPTASTTSVTLDKHKEVSFIVEDAARATANQDIMQRYMEAAIVPIAEQIETDLFTAASGFTSNVGTYGTDLTADVIRKAHKQLNDNKVPLEGRSLVLSTKDEIALMSDSSLQSYFAFANPATVKEGSIGRLYGFDLYSSQLVPTSGSAPVQTKNVALNSGGLILAMRGLPEAPAGSGAQTSVVSDPVSGLSLRVTVAYNPANLGVQVTTDVLYGVGKLRDAKGVLVKS